MRTLLAIAALMLSANTASAQLRIRAPFVRVDVNGGVHVRAPFVNLFIPGGPPPVYVAPLPPPAFVPPAPRLLDETEPPAPPASPAPKPTPRPRDRGDAPPPAAASAGLTVEAFVKSFKPKAGNYEVELINPVNNQPATVRFTLPEGTPRRVHVSRREIEFDYGARQYVKIQFDDDGAVVISR
jgi:hypothetical protein